MKKLNINQGGHKRSNNDLVHLYQCIVDVVKVFQGVFSSLDTPYIVEGCSITADVGANKVLCSEGIVYYNKTFYNVKAQELVGVDGAKLGFVIDDVPKSDNPVPYASSTLYDVHTEEFLVLNRGDDCLFFCKDFHYTATFDANGVEHGFDFQYINTNNKAVFNWERSRGVGNVLVYRGERWVLPDNLSVDVPIASGYYNKKYYLCATFDDFGKLDLSFREAKEGLFIAEISLYDEGESYTPHQVYINQNEDIHLNLKVFKKAYVSEFYPLFNHVDRKSVV